MRAANQKKIDDKLELIDEDIKFLEQYVKTLRSGFDEVKLQRTKPTHLFKLLTYDYASIKRKVSSDMPCLARLLMWEHDSRPVIKRTVKIMKRLRQTCETIDRDEKNRAHQKELRQNFTVGALVQLDPALLKFRQKHSTQGGLFVRHTTRTRFAGGRYNDKTNRFENREITYKSPPYYKCKWLRAGGYLKIDEDMHAIVLDNKTSKTYVEVQVANHRYWMKRNDLIVVQN